MMALDEAIREAQACASPPPANELETCDRIVYPLLRAAGYDAIKIAAQRHSHGIPDYTILPADSAYTWYVEAKAWSAALDENHASQALMYAYLNGKRWVMLTNGREWRLYDARVMADCSRERVVLCARLEDGSAMSELLSAIGPKSLYSGHLDEVADRVQAVRDAARAASRRRSRLTGVLPGLLIDPESDLVEWMCEVLRGHDGLENLTPEEVAHYFSKREHHRSADPAVAPPVGTPGAGVRVQAGLPAAQQQFWQGFLAEAAARGIDTSHWSVPKSENWIVHHYVRRPTNFAYMRRKASTHVELYLSLGDTRSTAQAFDTLSDVKAEIESDFGAPLIWRHSVASMRITHQIPLGGLDDGPESWPGAYDAMLDAMPLLIAALEPRLRVVPGLAS